MAWGRSLILVLPILASATLTRADELFILGGKSFTGTLASINDTQVTIGTPTGNVSQPFTQVLAVNIRNVKGVPPGEKFDAVRLIDGTVLHCKGVDFQGDKVELALFSGTKFQLSLAMVASYFREANQEALARKFADIAATKVRRDRIVTLRDGSLNPLEGLLGAVDAKAQTIKFKPETSDNTVDLPLSRLQGMVFLRTDTTTETPICKVFDTDGNSLLAVKLTYAGTHLDVLTTFGAKLTLSGESLARLDFNLGKLTYLSDLEPAKVLEKSGIGLINRYHKDTNLDGEPIFLGKPFAKGLSLHAYTELEYNVARKYKTFKALLGVDVRTGADSQPLVTIYCDGVKKFSETATVKELRPIVVDLTDVTVLKIVVSSRSFLDLHDHATLADARVSQE